MITVDSELRKVILQSKSLTDVGTAFRRAKMLYLQEQILRKTIAGETSVNELVRALTPAKKPAPKKT